MSSPPSLDAFMAYYDDAHRDPRNRAIHHLAHALAVIGAVLLLFRPLLGVLLLTSALPLSWSGHFLFERNTPAFFDAPTGDAPHAGAAKKAEVALGGVLWSLACLWRRVAHHA
jgi:hypothetical protein